MEVGNRIKLMKKSREGQRQGATGGHAGMKTGKEKQRKRGREEETEGEKEVSRLKGDEIKSKGRKKNKL